MNNKNKPCLLTRIIDFLSPKVTALLFVNSQIGVFASVKISIIFRQIGSHVGVAVHFFGVSCLLSKSVHMYILKPNKETNTLERKAVSNFCFGKTETSAQASMEV